MTPYFIEFKTKIPQLFCFTQVLEENFDNILINSFVDSFEQKQQESWLEYWNTEGEELILQGWNEKYRDYLKDNEYKEIIEHTEDQSKTANAVENATVSSRVKNLKSIDPNTYQSSVTEEDTVQNHNNPADEQQFYTWDDLWEQHRHDIYVEQYLIFTTIFHNYFLDLKNSLDNTLPKVEEEEKERKHQSETEHLDVAEELELLKLFGLPTSFGGKTKPSSKKSKKHTSKNLHFSDFFLESEFEDDSGGSEMEEDSEAHAVPQPEELFSIHTTENTEIAKAAKRTKKKNRKLKKVPAFILKEKGLLKYWRKRFSLFSRFDEGIRLDRESWFSVTPEKVAKHLAERLNCSILVDAFCGSGGNAIQFAQTCDRVIAIDIDPVKLEMAKHNAKIYNVDHKIEFILADFLQLAHSGKLKADTVFLSPPWGGPMYKNKKEYDIEKYLLPVSGTELVAAARLVSANVALFLPRNSNIKQIVRLAGVGNRCEIEHNYLDSRLVAITALYGEEILVKKTISSS